MNSLGKLLIFFFLQHLSPPLNFQNFYYHSLLVLSQRLFEVCSILTFF